MLPDHSQIEIKSLCMTEKKAKKNKDDKKKKKKNVSRQEPNI